MNKNELIIAEQRLSDPWWRLCSLYHIVDKQGNLCLFKPNWAQTELYKSMWYCNIVLKARQLGISSMIILIFLDRCLFNSNVASGIICHTREDAELLFKRVKLAYDHLPEQIKALRMATVDSARELRFSNGSSLRVGTSMRGSTLQYLHISEFGKICAKFPDKANEIITGSLNTIAPGQYIFIESTAEGREGYFYDLCRKAQELAAQETELSKLDFKFHFFPWHKEPSYKLESKVFIPDELLEYFKSLIAKGVPIKPKQAFWYVSRYATQQEDMKKEYPSTPEEAWEQSNEGLYYGRLITETRLDKRITHVPYDKKIPVHTAWDLGYNDSSAIWWFQVVNEHEVHIIDYIEGSGESLSHWLGVVKSKPYEYGVHLAPHDIMVHEFTSGMTRQASARKMGINFIPAQKVEIIPSIDKVRSLLSRCWFDEKKCAQGIKALENYKKTWDDRHGCWNSGPLHSWASHGSDAFRTLATGLHFIVNSTTPIDARTLGPPRHSPFGRHSIFG